MKTIKFYTLGCKANQYDTQVIRERFINAGFKEIEGAHSADICLINTCTVTGNADSKSIGIIRRAIRENPDAKIIVAGCLTKLDSDKIKAIDKKISIIKDKSKVNPPNSQTPKLPNSISFFKSHTRAFLKIQDGCDNFCSYCKVPLVRGGSKSRALKDVIQEAASLVKNGFKEIVLTGICLGAYGKDLKPKLKLTDVIEALEEINGLERIRLSSIEAGDVSADIIAKMSFSKKLCRHLHIPIQSGDDTILKNMNRRYTSSEYSALIKRVKQKIPGIAITTDVLVGFPGEAEENFQNTVKLIKEILPLKTHIFPYSVRQGTLAAKQFDKVLKPEVMKKRLEALKAAALDCSLKYRKAFIGKTMDVLVEKANEGFTDNYLKVFIADGRGDLKNQIVAVKLKAIAGEGVTAELP